MDCVGRVLGGILSRFRITLPDEIQEHKRYARSMYHNALECDGIRAGTAEKPAWSIPSRTYTRMRQPSHDQQILFGRWMTIMLQESLWTVKKCLEDSCVV